MRKRFVFIAPIVAITMLVLVLYFYPWSSQQGDISSQQGDISSQQEMISPRDIRTDGDQQTTPVVNITSKEMQLPSEKSLNEQKKEEILDRFSRLTKVEQELGFPVEPGQGLVLNPPFSPEESQE